MSLETELPNELTRRNILPPDPRKNLYDEDLHARGQQLPVKREIMRNRFNKFEDFIADVCDETYSSLVEYRLTKPRHLD